MNERHQPLQSYDLSILSWLVYYYKTLIWAGESDHAPNDEEKMLISMAKGTTTQEPRPHKELARSFTAIKSSDFLNTFGGFVYNSKKI